MTEPAARLWFGRTTHVREQPFRRSFTHRIAMLEIDIDRLAEADKLARLFSVGKRNAISFRPTDLGARNAAVPLRAWAEGRFAEADISLDGGKLRLVTFPRVLGYGFAPISIWLGYGPDGALRGVIYEVHNTFGETHSYVSAFHTDMRGKSDKEFHVSPFLDVSGAYRFTLRPPGRDMQLIVENTGANGRSHAATLTATPSALTTGAILHWLWSMPISGLGVVIAIHWQALRLWLKGVRYHDKPVQRAKRTSVVRPEDSLASAQNDLRKRA